MLFTKLSLTIKHKMVSNRLLKVALYTFGCKVNLFESEQLKKSLQNVEIVESSADADIYIINGCTVTAASDSQARNMIRRFVKKGRVIVTGCYARKKDPFLEELKGLEFIPEMEDVAQILESELVYDAFFDRSRPFLKIQSGCDQFCSYCIIPFVRGPLKSVPLEKVVNLLEKIRTENFKEVVLTGIHIGKYGVDLDDGSTLSDVIEQAYRIVGRVRLGSLESHEITDEIILQASENKILPHWHIPLQHGSDTVLKRMRRPYTTSDYRRSIEKIVEVAPAYTGFGTDIIAGFPGETEAEFLEAYRFIKSLPFSYGHVFPFSPREGTLAWVMEKTDGVKPEIKKERAAILRQLFAEKHNEFKDSIKGTKLTAIIENEISKDLYSATTENYLSIEIKGKYAPKELVSATI
jgi:threonylcarbamoyladenosine tRNA methylthiotransferase MtaB